MTVRRTAKLTTEQSLALVKNIGEELKCHTGHKAVLVQVSGRETCSFIVQIKRCGESYYGEYLRYDMYGEPMGRCTVYISPSTILTGDQTLIYLDRV